jgi:hypothetical protein
MEFVNNNFEDEYGLLADSMKSTMYHKAPDIFRMLNFDDDNNFLEPLFLLKGAYDPVPEFTFGQILFGYIEDDKKPEHIKALSSEKGIVYLPRYGYLKTSLGLRQVDVFFEKGVNILRVEVEGTPVAHEYIPLQYVENSQIEITKYNNPLNDDNYGTRENPAIVDINSAFLDHSSHVLRAMAIIRECNPWYYGYILRSVKKIVVFYNDQVRSFASKTTTGIAYISARKEYNEVFFLEDLVHQCAHNILYIMTIEMDDYFAVDAKNGRINQFNGKPEDQRTIYSAYHGIFSLVNICTTLSSVYNDNILTSHKQHELLGRLVDNLQRLGRGILDIKFRDAYTEKGWTLLLSIEEQYEKLLVEYNDLIYQYDVTDQPYVFDYTLFLSKNPL